MKGKVYLVGAGAGDFDLLTTKAERLIRSADAILYDSNVEGAILDIAKNSAVLVDAGKISGVQGENKEAVDEKLLSLAKDHESVVRLISGDPFVFSRGGEEACSLFASGVPFEVVPGVTSVTAASMYAGIPVTHRKHAKSLHILSGHGEIGKTLNFDFDALAKMGGTIVFMMSITKSEYIQNGLICAGMDKNTPCAVVENGTRSNQRKFIVSLENLAVAVAENAVKTPAIIIVGEVVKFSANLDWFSNKPLKNVSILSTQKAKSSSRLIPRLKENGADITFCPMVQTTSTLPQSFDISKYTIIAFSSMQGVESFFECIAKGGKDARALFGKKVACIGTQTAKTAKSRGIIADFIPEVFSGKDMACGMIENGMLTKDDNLLLVRPKDGTKEILDVLNENGIKYDDIPFYKTDYLSQTHIEDLSVFDYVAFTSKSGVESFANSQSHLDFSSSTAICIGDQTAEFAREYGFKVVAAKDGSMNGVVEEVIALEKAKQNK